MNASSPDVVVIYLRVSTEDQAKHGYSLPDQRDHCRRKARDVIGRDGFRVVEFEDTAGGDILERPALEQMREFVQENRPGYFICMDPDRFSRELFIQLLVTREIEAVGTQMVFVQHEYKNTAEGHLFYQLRGAISQYEKAKILARTKAGARRKVQQGQVATGTRPFGYDYDKEKDTIVPNLDEACWVETIFRWASERVLPLEIADRLNALGVPTKFGRLWRSSTIQWMLQNTTYVGQMVCFRWNTIGYTAQKQLPKEKRTLTPKKRPPSEWVTVAVAAIVDERVFAAVQAARKKHKRTAKGTAGTLSGIARCGLCGGAVHYIKDRVMGHVLRCHNRYPRRDAAHKPPRCTLPSVRASIIENRVWDQIAEWVLRPESLTDHMHRERDIKQNDAEIARLTPLLSGYQQHLADKRKEQAVIVKQMAGGRLDEEVGNELMTEAKGQIDTLLRQIKDTEMVIQALARANTLRDTLLDQVTAMRAELDYDDDKIRYVMERLPLDARRRALRLLDIEILLYPGREYRIVDAAGVPYLKRVGSQTRFVHGSFQDLLTLPTELC